MGTIRRRIAQSSDDAHQPGAAANGVINGTTVTVTGSNDWLGLRFQNVTIPQGATIDSAIIYFTLNDTANDSPDFNIYCEDVDDSTTFTTAVSDISGRTRTTAFTNWTATDIGIGVKASPNIAAPVQEVIDRAGWASGNDLNIIMDVLTAACDFKLRMWDFAAANAAYIEISWTTGDTPIDLYDETDTLDSSYSTVQDAVDAVPASPTGYTVRIGDGTYYEAVNLANTTVNIDKKAAGSIPTIAPCWYQLVNDLNQGWWEFYETTAGGQDVYKFTASVTVSNIHAMLDDDTPLWSYAGYNNTQSDNNLVDQVGGQGVFYGTAPGDSGAGYYITLTGNTDPNTVAIWVSFDDYCFNLNSSDGSIINNVYLKCAGDANVLLKNSDNVEIGSGVTCDYATYNIWAKNDGAGTHCDGLVVHDLTLIQRHDAAWTWAARKLGTGTRPQESSNLKIATGGDYQAYNLTIQGGFNTFNVGKTGSDTPYINADIHDCTVTTGPAGGQFDNLIEPENYVSKVRFWNITSTGGNYLPCSGTPLRVKGASGEVTICDSFIIMDNVSGTAGTAPPRITKHDAADTIDSDSSISMQIDHCTFVIYEAGYGIQMNVTTPSLISKYKFTNNIVYLAEDGKYCDGGPQAAYSCTVDGNIFYRVSGTGYVIRNLNNNAGNSYNSLALWLAGDGAGSGWTNNIEADPLIDLATGEITSGASPAIGAAIATSYDYGGDHASRPDIGFYQMPVVAGQLGVRRLGHVNLFGSLVQHRARGVRYG